MYIPLTGLCMGFTFETTPEPVEVKREIKNLMKKMIGKKWDWQSLAVWYGNRLPQYLWTRQDWKIELSKRGWRWQNFLSFFSRYTHEIVRWANDELSWNELIQLIERDLNSEIISRIYLNR